MLEPTWAQKGAVCKQNPLQDALLRELPYKDAFGSKIPSKIKLPGKPKTSISLQRGFKMQLFPHIAFRTPEASILGVFSEPLGAKIRKNAFQNGFQSALLQTLAKYIAQSNEKSRKLNFFGPQEKKSAVGARTLPGVGKTAFWFPKQQFLLGFLQRAILQL